MASIRRNLCAESTSPRKTGNRDEVFAFYNDRGECENRIEEFKNADLRLLMMAGAQPGSPVPPYGHSRIS